MREISMSDGPADDGVEAELCELIFDNVEASIDYVDENPIAVLSDVKAAADAIMAAGYTRVPRDDGGSSSSLRSDDLSHPAVGWQPISTAPKDGTAILAWGPGQFVRVCCYFAWGWGRVDTVSSPPFPLTHWQPLPVAPTDQQASKGGTEASADCEANQNSPIPDHVEAVARIIDPGAWRSVYDVTLATGFVSDRRKRALEKARAILQFLNGRGS